MSEGELEQRARPAHQATIDQLVDRGEGHREIQVDGTTRDLDVERVPEHRARPHQLQRIVPKSGQIARHCGSDSVRHAGGPFRPCQFLEEQWVPS